MSSIGTAGLFQLVSIQDGNKNSAGLKLLSVLVWAESVSCGGEQNTPALERMLAEQDGSTENESRITRTRIRLVQHKLRM